jgi:hypothetical protein
MPTNLTPIISSGPTNSNIGYNNSFIEVQGAGRTLYAQAEYDVTAGMIPGFSLPAFSYFQVAYYGSTNNFRIVSYFSSENALIGQLSATYIGGEPTQDDAKLEIIRRVV